MSWNSLSICPLQRGRHKRPFSVKTPTHSAIYLELQSVEIPLVGTAPSKVRLFRIPSKLRTNVFGRDSEA